MIISVVTITKDNLSGLKRTVRSVQAQNGVCIDHVIVDGESTDGTAEFLESIQAVPGKYSVRVVQRSSQGVYDAINVGVQNVRGDVVGLLHAGDIFASDTVLKKITTEFERPDAPDFLYGDIHYVDSTGCLTRYYSGAETGKHKLTIGVAPPHPSLYMTVSCARRVGPYDTDFIIAADFEMFIRLFYGDYKGLYLPLDMVAMSRGGISSKLVNLIWTNNREKIRALKQNGLPAGWLSIARRYLFVLHGYFN